MAFSLYCLTCTVNQKRYVGITSGSPTHRWSQHVHDAGKGSRNPLHRAIRKYGALTFSIEILATTRSAKRIASLERSFIRTLGTSVRAGGYNVATGGQGPFGVIRSAETRTKVSAGLKRFYDSGDAREAMRMRERARMQIPSERERSRQGALKAWRDPAFRAQAVAGNRVRAQHPEARARMRALKLEQKPRSAKALVIEGCRYASIGDAVRALRIPHNTIVQRIRSPNFGGYAFADS